MTAPYIRLEDVVKRFAPGETPALDGVSAGIRSGIITGLVGPDGAGKTTLMRLMAGLLLPSEGNITVAGADSAREPGRIQQQLGYMPQKFGLYEDLTVLENMNLYADLRGLARAERRSAFDRLLRFTGLAPFTARRAGALSGGMKQKLGLACSLIKAPRLLLLDEPSVGVDPISRRELWEMARELSDEGICTVWSTAYLDEAERCDEVLLMNEGRLLFQGAPSELTGRLAHRSYVIENLARGRRAVLADALQSPGVIDGVSQGSAVRLVLAEGAQAPDPAALEAGTDARIRTVAPRFEDAFIDILGGGPGGYSPLSEKFPPIEGGEEHVVEARGLTKTFGNFTAVEHVDFSIRAGEIFGFLGPNGAGKSTTFKMLCGLLKPATGTATVAGHDLAHAASAARGRIGYMAQKFSLYGSLTVRQNLNFFSRVYGLSVRQRRAAREGMIEIFHLAPHLNTTADALPIGFKQRLALACSVMHNPAVLFLDEPTSGVDPITRREFWTHINAMVERGVTVMVTTHFMDEAEYCDRIAVIYQGRVIATASPDDLKESVRSDKLPDPSLEDAFIELIRRSEQQQEEAA
ncbi:MAG: ATP-binding cassette domain-containing protein [Gammaproteobacteria bacterium]